MDLSGDYGANNIDWLMAKVHSFQSGLFVVIGIGAAVLLWFWWRKRQRIRFYREKLSELRQKRKAARAAKKAGAKADT